MARGTFFVRTIATPQSVCPSNQVVVVTPYPYHICDAYPRHFTQELVAATTPRHRPPHHVTPLVRSPTQQAARSPSPIPMQTQYHFEDSGHHAALAKPKMMRRSGSKSGVMSQGAGLTIEGRQAAEFIPGPLPLPHPLPHPLRRARRFLWFDRFC